MLSNVPFRALSSDWFVLRTVALGVSCDLLGGQFTFGFLVVHIELQNETFIGIFVVSNAMSSCCL